MYNRYIPNGSSYSRVKPEEAGELPGGKQSTGSRSRSNPNSPKIKQEGTKQESVVRELLQGVSAPVRMQQSEGKNAGIAGILKALKLEELDSGDILLLLILLLLILEGDNMELAITLGLMLLLGLGDETVREDQKE